MEKIIQALITQVRADGRVELALSAVDSRRLRARFYNHRRMRRLVKDSSVDGITIRLLPSGIMFLLGSPFEQRVERAERVERTLQEAS